MKLKTNQLYYLTAYIIAIIVFHLNFGLAIVNPTNINWIMSAHHDWGIHYMGWAFYRTEPWTFPLGEIHNYAYPIVSNVGYTDSIPLLAFLLKPFQSFLSEDFQYLGFWLLCCYVLLAHFTLKILNLYKIKPLYALLIITLVVSNPVLWYRGIHPALCAHWLIIASLYLYLKPAAKATAKRINYQQIGIITCAAFIHPYLCAMVVGFNIILPLKHYLYGRKISVKQLIAYPALSLFSVLFSWFITGLISISNSQPLSNSNGFEYTLNLNSLYNSWNLTALFPAIAKEEGNFETFLYLGAGIMLLIIITIIALFAYKTSFTKKLSIYKSLLPLLVLTTLLTCFAISNRVVFNNHVLFEIPLPRILLKVCSIFRSSARFFWLPYYLIILFFSIIFLKLKIPAMLKSAILILVVGIQAYDLVPMYGMRNLSSGTYNTPFDDENWQNAFSAFDRIIVYPPFKPHNNNLHDWQDLTYIALKTHKPITSGSSARDNVDLGFKISDSIYYDISNNKADVNELYVTTPQNLKYFDVLLYSQKFEVIYMDGFYFVYSKSKKPNINSSEQEFLAKNDSLQKIYNAKARLRLLPKFSDKKINYNLEKVNIVNNLLYVKGWAFIENKKNNSGDSVFIAFTKADSTYITPLKSNKRPDVTSYFKADNLDNSGFAAILNTNLNIEDYKLGIAIKSINGDWAYSEIDEGILKKDYTIPIKFNSTMPEESNLQHSNVESVEVSITDIVISGWSVIDGKNSDDHNIKLMLSGANNFEVGTKTVMRKDVADYFKDIKFKSSGFSTKILKTDLPKGNYKIGVLITDSEGNTFLDTTDKTIKI